MSTAVEEMNIEAILAIMNTAELVIEIKLLCSMLCYLKRKL